MKSISKFLIVLIAVAACDRNDGNFSDEMKITGKPEISKTDGAKAQERKYDNRKSPYYHAIDFYNAKSTDTLTIIPRYKTIQQSSEWSCAMASIMMVLEHFGRLGDWDEASLGQLRPVKHEKLTPWIAEYRRVHGLENSPTHLFDMIYIFEHIGGFDIISSYDYGDDISEKVTLETLENFVRQGLPVMVLWNDMGGHWQTIIGYDNMGTETKKDDVLIVADSLDITDHNQDGYSIYPAYRFINNWTMSGFREQNPRDNDFLFIVVKPKESN